MSLDSTHMRPELWLSHSRSFAQQDFDNLSIAVDAIWRNIASAINLIPSTCVTRSEMRKLRQVKDIDPDQVNFTLLHEAVMSAYSVECVAITSKYAPYLWLHRSYLQMEQQLDLLKHLIEQRDLDGISSLLGLAKPGSIQDLHSLILDIQTQNKHDPDSMQSLLVLFLPYCNSLNPLQRYSVLQPLIHQMDVNHDTLSAICWLLDSGPIPNETMAFLILNSLWHLPVEKQLFVAPYMHKLSESDAYEVFIKILHSERNDPLLIMKQYIIPHFINKKALPFIMLEGLSSNDLLQKLALLACVTNMHEDFVFSLILDISQRNHSCKEQVMILIITRSGLNAQNLINLLPEVNDLSAVKSIILGCYRNLCLILDSSDRTDLLFTIFELYNEDLIPEIDWIMQSGDILFDNVKTWMSSHDPNDDFLKECGKRIMSNINYPISLEEIRAFPFDTLRTWCQTPNLWPIRFRINDQTIDLGGVSKCVYQTLWNSLAEQNLYIIDGLPNLINVPLNRLDQTLEAYELLGTFYSYLMDLNTGRSDPYLSGPIFSSDLFHLLRTVLITSANSSQINCKQEEQIAISNYLLSSLKDHSFSTYYQSCCQYLVQPTEPNAVQVLAHMIEVGEVVSQNENPEGNKDLIDLYVSRVINCLLDPLKKILSTASDTFKNKLIDSNPEEFTKEVQGSFLTKDLIKSLICLNIESLFLEDLPISFIMASIMEDNDDNLNQQDTIQEKQLFIETEIEQSPDPTLYIQNLKSNAQKKIEERLSLQLVWLNQLIEAADEKWIRQFLFAITSQHVIATTTRIQVCCTLNNLSTSSCFNSLNIPYHEKDQDLFNNNMNFLIQDSTFNIK